MNKAKKLLKVWVIALSMLFAVALALGITAAAYNSRRQANGTMNMGSGIVLDYIGFGKSSPDHWENETTTTFKLFTDADVLPGDIINLNTAIIKKGAGSIDFYTRIKFEYKFYDALNADITASILDYSAFMTTPEFTASWVDGNAGDGWFYYASGTILNALPAGPVHIFRSPTINIALNAEGFNHQGGGYKYSNSITITKVEALLTVETVQIAGSTWEINPLIQNSSNQVIEIQSNQITLGNAGGAYKLGTGEAGSLDYDATNLGTTLKIVVAGDSQINANAFENSDLENVYIGDAEYIAGVSSYSAKIYTTPATFKIGANAFRGCTNLNVYLSSSCNYQIYVSSFAGVGNVYLDGVLINVLKNPSVGVYNGCITVSANPSITTGGSGAGSVNQVLDSMGEYTYYDGLHTWYFDLGTIDIENKTWIKDNINGTQATIRKCGTSNGTLIIPSKISSNELAGNVLVVNISDHSFMSCTSLTSITIPSSVINIEEEAFGGCTGLTSIIIPDSIINISGRAFQHTGLTSIEIPSSVTSIGGGAFSGCSGLTQFISNNSKYTVSADGRCLIESNGDNYTLIAFAPSGLTSYTIPNLVTSIGNRVFLSCGYLISIQIPNSVINIGAMAFSCCGMLNSITIPNSVLSIGEMAFAQCNMLKNVIFESSENREYFQVGAWAFSGCINLTTLNWDGDWSGINITIGDYAFDGCPVEGNLNLPNQNQGE